MKKGLLFTVVTAALAAAAGAAPDASFERLAPRVSDIVAVAKQAPVPTIKEAGPVAPAAGPAAPAEAPAAGTTELRVVESRVEGGVAVVQKESICYKADGKTACVDEKTQEPAKLPEDLADFDFKKTIQEALALAAQGEFHLAHDYQTRNGNQCFQCWGVTEEYGCRWVQVRRGIPVTVEWEKVCAGTREVGHNCTEIACR